MKELAASCTTDADIAAAVYDYMVKNIQYDTEKAATVQNGYLPSPDETLKTGKGICFDYASLAAAITSSSVASFLPILIFSITVLLNSVTSWKTIE